MHQPLISVIVPTYNRRELLKLCLKSIFEQQLPQGEEMEIIVIDDGSADGTWDWLNEILPEHPEMVLLHLNDDGVAAARNAGLDAAKGKYLRFIDSDDEMSPGSMMAMLNAMQETDADLLVAPFFRKVGPTVSVRDVFKLDQSMSDKEYMDLFAKHANCYTVGVIWNKLFRRDLVEKAGIRFQGGMYYGEDFLFVAAYMEQVEKVRVIREPVYVYYLNPKSLTVKQVKNAIVHPVKSLRVKDLMYKGYKELFKKKGLYEKYAFRINTYMLRTNTDD